MSSVEEAVPQEITRNQIFNMVLDQELGVEQEQPEAVAEEESQQETAEEVPVLELDPQLPEDVATLLEEPETEEDDEPVFRVEEEDDFEYDEEKAQLKKKLKALEAKAEWLEKKRVETDRVKWIAEAEKFFPLSDPASITAESRKAFLRAAREQHTRNKPLFEKFSQNTISQAKKEAEQIKSDAKAAAEKAWGKPSVNLSPQAPAPRGQVQEDSDRAFQRGGLAAVIRAGFKGGE